MHRNRSLLIVSYHYLPSTTPGSRRVDAVAQRLAARGWSVTILTASPAGVGPASSGAVEVVRTSAAPPAASASGGPVITRPPRVAGAMLTFPDRYAGWSPALARRLSRLLSDRHYDAVYSSSPPHSSQFAVALVRARKRFSWVAEFRDPWMFPRRRRSSAISDAAQRRMEGFVLRSCDRVVANTEGNRAALLAAFPRLDATRVVVVPNGFDAADYATAVTDSSDCDLTYVGEVYPGMMAGYVAAISALRDRRPGSVPTLEIFGTLDPRERARLEHAGLSRFVVERGFVSHAQSVTAMRRARALLVLLPSGPQWATCVPSKVYWYLAARRPLIAWVPAGDTAAVVRRHGAGWVIDGTDPASAASALAGALEAARAWRPAADDSIAEYELSALADRLDTLLREVVHGSPQ